MQVSSCNIQTPSGNGIVPIYCVDLQLPNHVTIKEVQIAGSKIGQQGLGLIIGMNIMCIGDFAVSNFNGKTQFSFRIPSVADANFAQNEYSSALKAPFRQNGNHESDTSKS